MLRTADPDEPLLTAGTYVRVTVRPEGGRAFSFLGQGGRDGAIRGHPTRSYIEVGTDGVPTGRVQLVQASLIVSEVPLAVSRLYWDLVRPPRP